MTSKNDEATTQKTEESRLHVWLRRAWVAVAVALTMLALGLAADRVRLIDFCPDHPMIRLQRTKETLGIRDTALGLPRHNLEKMFTLMKQMRLVDCEVSLYAAGEIIELIQRTPLPKAQTKAIKRYICKFLTQASGTMGVLTR